MTDHVHNQLCQRIEELEAEKLELNEQIDTLQKERNALQFERDTLSFQIEIREGLVQRAIKKEEEIGRLKAQWQAEALGRVLAEVLAAVEADTVRAHLRNAMRKLRRQAEGGEA